MNKRSGFRPNYLRNQIAYQEQFTPTYGASSRAHLPAAITMTNTARRSGIPNYYDYSLNYDQTDQHNLRYNTNYHTKPHYHSQYRNKEHFDLVNNTQTTKVYVMVDEDTLSTAIGYDEKDTSNTAPIIMKAVDLNDKTQWVTSASDVGIVNFYYSAKNYFNIEISEDKSLGGIIPVRRSDRFKNAFFDFKDDHSIVFNPGSDETSVHYCLAFKKQKAPKANSSASIQQQDWNKRFSFYDKDSAKPPDSDSDSDDDNGDKSTDNDDNDGKSTDDDGKSKSSESFIVSWWNSLFGGTKENYDDNTCYLELVKYEGIDEKVYSYKWKFVEVWDQRTSTNLALETEQIKDLQTLDKDALSNADQAMTQLKAENKLVDDRYKQILNTLHGHLLGRMWVPEAADQNS